MLCVTVETLSGHSKIVDLSSSATLGDLRGAIGVELDVPSKYLQLAVGAALLPHDGSLVLESVGVEDGTQVSAIVQQCPPLPALSSTFKVELKSSRMRLGFHRNSSQFTMVYELQVDVEKSLIWASVIRKDDTDHWEFDGKKGSWRGDRGHWMSGTTQIQEQPLPCFHLGDLLRDWMARAEAVFDSEKQLWTMPSQGAITKLTEDEDEQGEEEEVGENGWFVAPSSDCFELYVNAPFPVSGLAKHNPLHIARVLVDASGNPVRAAIYYDYGEQNVSPKDHVQKADVHDIARFGNFLLEEFDVTLTNDVVLCSEFGC